jgi:hypothetical protein
MLFQKASLKEITHYLVGLRQRQKATRGGKLAHQRSRRALCGSNRLIGPADGFFGETPT